MTVKELIEALKKLPDDMQVVLAKDAEGNDFSPLADLTLGIYDACTTWYGDFYTYDNEGYKLSEEELNAVCLGPVN